MEKQIMTSTLKQLQAGREVGTEGPWSVPHMAEPEINCECKYVLTDYLMGAVCEIYASGEGDDWISGGDNPKFAEACANARRIARVPELEAALIEAVELLQANIMVEPDDEKAAAAFDDAYAFLSRMNGDER